MPQEEKNRETSASSVICAGRSGIENIFRVEEFPTSASRSRESSQLIVNFGEAGNAAVAISHLGGHAKLVSPIGGPKGDDPIGDQILAALDRNGVDHSGIVRLPGARSPIISCIIDRDNRRLVTGYDDDDLMSARLEQPDTIVSSAAAVVADNYFPEFVLPIFSLAKDRRIPAVLSVKKRLNESDGMLSLASHVMISADLLRDITGESRIEDGLATLRKRTPAFLAVNNGLTEAHWLDGTSLQCLEVKISNPVNCEGLEDLFRGAFTLSLAEGHTELSALSFASRAAAVKSSRTGGIAATPTRADVDILLSAHT